MKLKSPSSDDVDHPTIALVNEAIEGLDPEDDSPFLILENPDLGNTFIQTWRNSPRWYTVEFRDALTGRQYRVENLRQSVVCDLFQRYLAGDESFRQSVPWEDISEYLMRREMNGIQQAIAKLTDAASVLTQHKDESPVIPEGGKLYRTFNDSLVCVVSVDEDDEGRVVVLQGGHGHKDSDGAKPGGFYQVDAEGYYRQSSPGIETVMSLREIVEFTAPALWAERISPLGRQTVEPGAAPDQGR